MLFIDLADVLILLSDIFEAKNRKLSAYLFGALCVLFGILIIAAGLLDVFGDAAEWVGGGLLAIGLVVIAIASRLRSDKRESDS